MRVSPEASAQRGGYGEERYEKADFQARVGGAGKGGGCSSEGVRTVPGEAPVCCVLRTQGEMVQPRRGRGKRVVAHRSGQRMQGGLWVKTL